MQSSNSRESAGVTRIVERNIEMLLARRQAEENRLGWQEKIANAITRFTGSMTFVGIHALGFALWVVINLGWLPWIPRFDPTFVVLAMVASVEAIFLSTFILITQNRMMAQADRRADLNLQISLLAEHEITRLIQITTHMAERLGATEAVRDPELAELSKDVNPERVLDSLEEKERHLTTRMESEQ